MLICSLCSFKVSTLIVTSSLQNSSRILTWSIAVPAHIAFLREASCEKSSSGSRPRVLERLSPCDIYTQTVDCE